MDEFWIQFIRTVGSAMIGAGVGCWLGVIPLTLKYHRDYFGKQNVSFLRAGVMATVVGIMIHFIMWRVTAGGN